MKRLQVRRDGAPSDQKRNRLCKNSETFSNSTSIKVMQTAKDRGHISTRVAPSRGCSIGKKALQVDSGANGVTKSNCDPLRGFWLSEDGSRKGIQDWNDLKEANFSREELAL